MIQAAPFEFERAGFREVTGARFGDSSAAKFAHVEEEVRGANIIYLRMPVPSMARAPGAIGDDDVLAWA